MKTFFKIISSFILLLLASLIVYISYLYIQNPVVVSRLGGVLLGNSPGIPELVRAKNSLLISETTTKTKAQRLSFFFVCRRATTFVAVYAFIVACISLIEFFVANSSGAMLGLDHGDCHDDSIFN